MIFWIIMYLIGVVTAWVTFKAYRKTEPDYIGGTWFAAGFNIGIALLSWLGFITALLIWAANSKDDSTKLPPKWL